MDISNRDQDLLHPITSAEKASKKEEAGEGKGTKGKKRCTPIVPVPNHMLPFHKNIFDYHNTQFKKEVDHIYEYRLTENSLAMVIGRWDHVKQRDGTFKKEIRPYIYGIDATGKAGWHFQFLDDLPLYNLPGLTDKKDLLFVEGEKTAEAAKILFPDYSVTTTAGGSNSAHKTDFSPVKGMRILISPDCGEAGDKYGDQVYKRCRKAHARCIQQFDTKAFSKLIVEDGEVVDRDSDTNPAKESYDLADALADGWTAELMAAHRDKFISAYLGKDCEVSGNPEGVDFIEQKKRKPLLPPGLIIIGSDFEVGRRALQDLKQKYGQIIFTDGEFYRYKESQWVALTSKELHDGIEKYDGYSYRNPEKDSNVKIKVLKLNASKKNSALHTMEQGASSKDFFKEASVGVNCANGFIRFIFDGETKKWKAAIEGHSPEHRQRHTLPGKWGGNAPMWVPGSFHSRLLNGSFWGDEDRGSKIQSMKELAGATISGCATKLLQPRAVILLGTQAENGKSQVLNMLRGLLPSSAISSVTAAKMADERHILGICGKLLNASDELSGSSAISSEVFKAIITGETVSGRDVYKSRVEFTPVAQHVFATNTLPSFQGGMDRGVQRRLLVMPFNRVIPREEKIENIGRRIAEEEMDLLLAWAVEGALDLMNNRGFTITEAFIKNLQDWLEESDSVQGWVAECIEILNDEQACLKTSYAYQCYQAWTKEQGTRHKDRANRWLKKLCQKDGVH